MKYVAPSAEELSRRGLDPDGNPLKPQPKPKATKVTEAPKAKGDSKAKKE